MLCTNTPAQMQLSQMIRWLWCVTNPAWSKLLGRNYPNCVTDTHHPTAAECDSLLRQYSGCCSRSLPFRAIVRQAVAGSVCSLHAVQMGQDYRSIICTSKLTPDTWLQARDDFLGDRDMCALCFSPKEPLSWIAIVFRDIVFFFALSYLLGEVQHPSKQSQAAS